jgi:xeroderma pigmentosum group C-complementing protein
VEHSPGGFIVETESVYNSGHLIAEGADLNQPANEQAGNPDFPVTLSKQKGENEPISPQSQGLATLTGPLLAVTTAGEMDVEAPQDASPASSSPSDAGSLPLEDPEDDDADPDWLVEAT